MENICIRNAEPSGYLPIISVINAWWGNRNMADMLPKLFFVHFRQTSFVAEHGDDIVGFLIGFASQTSPVNRGSVAFHLRMDFSMEPTEKTVDGISVVEDYDGRGEHRVLFSRTLSS